MNGGARDLELSGDANDVGLRRVFHRIVCGEVRVGFPLGSDRLQRMGSGVLHLACGDNAFPAERRLASRLPRGNFRC